MGMLKINESFSMYYEVVGEGIPLLLLHGFTGSSQTWEPFIEMWKSRFQVIRVDIAGHRKSQVEHEVRAHPEAYSMEQMAQALLKLLDHLKIDQTAVLGYSMGARLALYFVVHHMNRVRGLVLESGSPGLKEPDERASRRAHDDILALKILDYGVPHFVNYWESIPLFSTQSRLPQPVQARIREERLEQTPYGLAGSLRGMGTGSQPSLWDNLKYVDLPVCLIVGEWDSKFIAINKEMEKSLPLATFFKVPEAGHAVHVEQIDFFAKIVRDVFYNLLLGSNRSEK